MIAETMLFSAAPGLHMPWQVSEVKFDPSAKELHLYLTFAAGSQFACPGCGAACKAYDTSPRVWRHLNFFEHKSFLHADIARVSCPACGVKTADVPWARPGSGFTLLFEALVLILCSQMPVRAAARIAGEHDTRLWRLLDAYVEKARKETDMSAVTKLGVDETSFKPGHQYVTLAADLDERRVLFVTEGKDAQTLARFNADFQAHGGDPAAVETICMDLSPAFQAGASEQFPGADKVFDRFHVVKLANAAVDSIRRAEAKSNELLKGSRYLFLANPDSLSDAKKRRLADMKELNLATAQAYQMKLNLQEMWTLPGREQAAAHLDEWYKWIMSSSIGAPMRKLAKTVKAHASGILAFFPSRLTSGLMEGVNSLIQAAKAKARGYRTLKNFRIIIYLIAGRLNLGLPT